MFDNEGLRIRQFVQFVDSDVYREFERVGTVEVTARELEGRRRERELRDIQAFGGAGGASAASGLVAGSGAAVSGFSRPAVFGALVPAVGRRPNASGATVPGVGRGGLVSGFGAGDVGSNRPISSSGNSSDNNSVGGNSGRGEFSSSGRAGFSGGRGRGRGNGGL